MGCDISTMIKYSIIDYRIHGYDWTLPQVIIVFSSPTLLSLILIFFLSRLFERKKIRIRLFHWVRRLSKRQRIKMREEARIRKREKGEFLQQKIQRIKQGLPSDPLSDLNQVPAGKKGLRKFSWPMKLFLLWMMYHSITYFFSGMLFSAVFYRRFGYVIWYIFNSNGFNLFFSGIAFIFMIILGFVFAAQFLYSAKIYFNDLTDRFRIPFVISQALLPFAIGSLLSFIAQMPRLSLTMTIMNFSILLLLIPLPIRGTYFPELHFDNKEKKVRIFWKWFFASIGIIVLILFALKVGITFSI
jgi:hypothetical protein